MLRAEGQVIEVLLFLQGPKVPTIVRLESRLPWKEQPHPNKSSNYASNPAFATFEKSKALVTHDGHRKQFMGGKNLIFIFQDI